MDSDVKKNPQADVEEFSIMELDDRLEFVAWCDTNCNCTGKGSNG